jgi:hypothetical protein
MEKNDTHDLCDLSDLIREVPSHFLHRQLTSSRSFRCTTYIDIGRQVRPGSLYTLNYSLPS